MTELLKNAVNIFASVLEIMIFIRIIASWLPIGRDSQLMRVLYALTEPILGPIRELLHKSPLGGPGMVLDFSPMIAWMFIQLGNVVLIRLIDLL